MVDSIPPNVLVVAGDADTAQLVKETLAKKAIAALYVRDMSAAAGKIDDRPWDLMMIDLAASGDAASLLEKVRQSLPELPVILFGDEASLFAAEKAFCQPGTRILPKPVVRESFESLVDVLLPANRMPAAITAETDPFCAYQIVGASEKFLQTIRLACKVAPTAMPVLITGESGTGKELVSSLIHRQSRRANGPFIHVNCAALSETLLESELFGHERGAFTGAHEQRKGRFERAHGGTLLLDEISETTQKLQAELLRVLEQQNFERVGGSQPIRVNVRVIITSNRDLEEEVRQGRFRRDLYYRICGVHLTLLPLRERKEDIPMLVWHFVNLHARETNRQIAELSEQMMQLFSQCHWPGNVRQLRNVVRAAMVFGEGPTLSLDGAPFLQNEMLQTGKAQPSTLQLHEIERQAILEALRRTKRNQAKAARLLGISDRTLREKLRRYQETSEPQTAGENRW